MRTACLITLFAFLRLSSVAQDTIRLEPRVQYYAAIDSVRDRMFAAHARYAKEEIIFSDRHKKIQYCYYYDQERVCYGNEYKIISDSILQTNEEQWIYKREGELYKVWRIKKGYYESGYAKSLMPLETIGLFTTTSLNFKDTLWHTDHTKEKPNRPYSHPAYFFHRHKIAGKIYDVREMDSLPPILKAQMPLELKIDPDNFCINDAMSRHHRISFILTANGRMVNFEQRKDDPEVQFCPYEVLDILRQLYSTFLVKPVLLDGKPVNVRCYLIIKGKYN
jgi:hypothetical protein